MPLDAELVELYGPSYLLSSEEENLALSTSDQSSADWVVNCLVEESANLFVDLGCGAGELLAAVTDAGFQALGFDVDARTVASASASVGCQILTTDKVEGYFGRASVVHLGDVLEHVSDPSAVLTTAEALLEPEGVFLAQGPVEANISLFNFCLGVNALLHLGAPVTDPPHHVHMASQRGQEAFFVRHGLCIDEFTVSDVAWPAPSRFERAMLSQPRPLALYSLRRVSSLLSRLLPGRALNRYRVRGRWT